MLMKHAMYLNARAAVTEFDEGISERLEEEDELEAGLNGLRSPAELRAKPASVKYGLRLLGRVLRG